MKKRILSLLLILVMVLSMASVITADPGAAASATGNKGSLVIVGGALASTNKAVYDKFIELAGGKDKAKIGIIPAASTNLRSSTAFKADLERYGVKPENVEVLQLAVRDDSRTKDVDESKWIENAAKPEMANKIKTLTGIWFVGGDQTRITKLLLKADGTNSLALDAIWEVYNKGGVLGGTSAGAAIMSNPMIAGGNSLGAINYGFTTKYINENDQLNGPVYLEKGLGFFPHGVIDQHFDARARLGRLTVTAYEYKDQYSQGFGIDEDTALIYNGKTHDIEVAGAGGVTVVDVSIANKDDRFKQAAITDVKLSFLSPEDRYNAVTKKFTVSKFKDSTKGYEYYYVKGPITATGVLSGYSKTKEFIMYNLLDNEAVNEIKSYCYDENGAGAEIVFRKGPGTEGFWGYMDGNKDSYSGVNVYMDIHPIEVSIAYKFHIVKSGDKLEDVAKKLNTTVNELLIVNNIKSALDVKPGTKLIAPNK